VHAGAGRQEGRDFFGRRVEVLFEQIGIFQKLRYQTRRRSPRPPSRRSSRTGRSRRARGNEFKSVMSQRVVVDQLLPIERGGRRGPTGAEVTVVRAVGAGNLRSAPRFIEVYRGSSSQRSGARGADDRDGHATNNSADMISSLTLYMNKPGGDRARDY
jgi:hypothetical protein